MLYQLEEVEDPDQKCPGRENGSVLFASGFSVVGAVAVWSQMCGWALQVEDLAWVQAL